MTESHYTVFPVHGASITDIPSTPHARYATGFIRADQIPDLSAFRSINPRSAVPKGEVPQAIFHTLTEHPLQMALKNAGLYILAEHVRRGAGGSLLAEIYDPSRHGLVNGGHTYAMIREAMAGSDLQRLQTAKAYVPIHIYTGIPDSLIVEMASGLNNTRQVQVASLENLRGHYDAIKTAMNGHRGGDAIRYFEGSPGSVAIAEILQIIETFNFVRFPAPENPYHLYANPKRVIAAASEDFSLRPMVMQAVVDRLPSILELADNIRQAVEYHREKLDRKVRGRGRPNQTCERAPNTLLPFSGQIVKTRLPNGWLFPCLAAFRANAAMKGESLAWKVSNLNLLRRVAPTLAEICYRVQRASSNRPEWVGKKEIAYEECRAVVSLEVQKTELARVKNGFR